MFFVEAFLVFGVGVALVVPQIPMLVLRSFETTVTALLLHGPCCATPNYRLTFIVDESGRRKGPSAPERGLG